MFSCRSQELLLPPACPSVLTAVGQQILVLISAEVSACVSLTPRWTPAGKAVGVSAGRVSAALCSPYRTPRGSLRHVTAPRPVQTWVQSERRKTGAFPRANLYTRQRRGVPLCPRSETRVFHVHYFLVVSTSKVMRQPGTKERTQSLQRRHDTLEDLECVDGRTARLLTLSFKPAEACAA